MPNDSISDEDKALFRANMKSVKPLNEKTKRILKPANKASTRTARAPLEGGSTPSYPNYFLSNYLKEVVQANSSLAYASSSIPKKRFNELKNGNIPWEAKLDLHGLNTEQARKALEQFLHEQRIQNRPCVLIIHGKGNREGEAPIIKNLVNRWLPQCNEVLAFCSAQAKHGGYGAVYVLLRRKKAGDNLRS